MAHNIIIERDVMVPMRDGVRLAIDVYRPDDGAKHPVLVNGHPYDNDHFLATHELLFSPLVAAQRGYAVVVQEARGRAGSEGTWRPYGDEGRDAYDTVEWAAAQPWSDGNVGLYGACALGWTAIQGAVEAPPHLKAVFAYMTATNYHSGWTYSGGGAFELGFQLSWVWTILARDTISRLGLEPAALEEAERKLTEAASDVRGSARYLPLVDFPAYQNGAAPYWREWLSHPGYDEFWRRVDAIARADCIKVPILHMSAWYDLCLKGHLDLHSALQLRGDERRPRSAPTGSRPLGPQCVLQQATHLRRRARLRPLGADRPRRAGRVSPSSGSTTGSGGRGMASCRRARSATSRWGKMSGRRSTPGLRLTPSYPTTSTARAGPTAGWGTAC